MVIESGLLVLALLPVQLENGLAELLAVAVNVNVVLAK
jgi:hypothetical protein